MSPATTALRSCGPGPIGPEPLLAATPRVENRRAATRVVAAGRSDVDESLVHVVLRAGADGPVEFVVLSARARTREPGPGVHLCDPRPTTARPGVVRVEVRDLLVDSEPFTSALRQGRLEDFRQLAHRCVEVVVIGALARSGLELVGEARATAGLAQGVDRLIDALAA